MISGANQASRHIFSRVLLQHILPRFSPGGSLTPAACQLTSKVLIGPSNVRKAHAKTINK